MYKKNREKTSCKEVLPVEQTSDQCVFWQWWVETQQIPESEERIHRLSAKQWKENGKQGYSCTFSKELRKVRE